MNKLTVGQKVFLKPINNAARGSSEIKEEVICKVGKKFFYVGNGVTSFYIESMLHNNGQFTPNYVAYLDRQQILDENEAIKINNSIYTYFFKTPRLPLDKLRKIKEIIES